VWLVARHGTVHTGAAGTMDLDCGDAAPASRDRIFRIASLTKPITAVAALVLVEECHVHLDDPVDAWLPELTDRRVLARPDGPLDETVPALRAITLRDLLTSRMGIGMDFTAFGAQPVMDAFSALELGFGPPQPQRPPAADEWIRRFGTLPLERQPGERWLYDTSSDVLGVLIERASGLPLASFVHERVFEPLGMVDTGFSVPPTKRARFGAAYAADPESGVRTTFDATDGQWSRPPSFASGGGGLVSTVDDLFAFAEMLLGGGAARNARILARPTVDAMTTNHLSAEQIATCGPDPSGALGWGFGVGVRIARTGPAHSVGTYGWDGGLGSSWANDPREDLVGVLLTNQAFTSPTGPAVVRDFWTAAYAAITD
jgi:CubicO group peptidase (beta-lactamase class C family)